LALSISRLLKIKLIRTIKRQARCRSATFMVFRSHAAPNDQGGSRERTLLFRN
jgi:hypothetical protein